MKSSIAIVIKYVDFSMEESRFQCMDLGRCDTCEEQNLRIWYGNVFLPPATKLRQCNVFTPVCDSVHRGVSV